MRLKLKRKIFFGYPETDTNGVSYLPAQVTLDYVIDPVETALDYVDKSPVGSLDGVKRKVRPLKSIKDYIKWKLRGNKKSKDDTKKK